MLPVFRHLWLGLLLIVGASGVLLISDLRNRVPASAHLSKVAILQFASRPTLDQGQRGVLEGLASEGYVEGRNLVVQRFNAENDMPTSSNMARAIVDGGFRLVITISTPSLQAMASANKEGKVIQVFGLVTDPFLSGVGIDRKDSLRRPRHLVGIGSFQPVRSTFQLAKQLFPGLKRVGEVWNPAEACSEACTMLAREVCRELGIELLEANVDSSAAVLEAAKSLTSRGIQALWIGGDNTVDMAAAVIIKVAGEAGIPVFTNSPSNAEQGALFTLGADYIEVGKATGVLAGKVLNGLDPATIRIENVMPECLLLNERMLASLREPWRFPEEVRRRAAGIVGSTGGSGETVPSAVKTQELPRSSSLRSGQAMPVGRLQRIHFLNYIQASHVEANHKGFFDELKKLGLVEGRDYSIKVSNAQGDMTTLSAMVDAALSDRADLIVLTSTPTLQATLKKVRNIPVLFSNVASPVLAGAGRSDTDHLPNITGISTLSDFQEMTRVLKICLPQVKRVGTLFASGEDNSVYNKERFQEILAQNGIELLTVPTSNSAEVLDAALTLAGMPIDAICQITDNVHDTAFAGIAQAAQKSRKPLFAFISAKVLNGGAVLAVSRDYEQAGRDMARLAQRVMRGESPAGIPFQLVSRTLLVIKPANAVLYGLKIPAQLLNRADQVVP